MNENGEGNDATMVNRCLLQSASGCAINVYDHFRSATAFLICSGPSIRDLDLGCLQSRGILTCTTNNAGSLFRSNLWVAYDNPGNFCDVIWRDPGILKFIPIQRFDQSIRIRDLNGALVESDETARTMPATFGYKTNLTFRPNCWLNEDSINCGDRDESEENKKGPTGTRSVMFVALRLLHYLGIRRVFLLGCDFRMSYGGENYAFEQSRSRRSVRMNNYIYRTLNERFKMLLPHFEKGGFDVRNCTPNSSLTVFPHVELEDAVRLATKNMPNRIQTNGMYDQREKS